MDLEFRPLRWSDAEQLLLDFLSNLSVATHSNWTEHFHHQIEPPFDAFRVAKKMCELNGQAEQIYVAYDKSTNEIVAVGHFYNSYWDARHLGLAVRDSYQRQGIGTHMLDFLLTTLRVYMVKYVFLDVYADNEAAQGLYEKFDFHVINDYIDCNNRKRYTLMMVLQ